MKDIRMMTDEELTGEFKATVESDHLRGGYTDETEACKKKLLRRLKSSNYAYDENSVFGGTDYD